MRMSGFENDENGNNANLMHDDDDDDGCWIQGGEHRKEKVNLAEIERIASNSAVSGSPGNKQTEDYVYSTPQLFHPTFERFVQASNNLWADFNTNCDRNDDMDEMETEANDEAYKSADETASISYETDTTIANCDSDADSLFAEEQLFFESATPSSRVAMGKQYEHVVKNFPLFGYTTIELSFFQAVKELVENAIDAIRAAYDANDNDRHTLDVSITEHPSNPDFSVLCVSDSGCGITCIADALQTFNSICNSGSNCEGKNDYYDNSGDKRGGSGGCIASDKKTISTFSRIGKYGVGLSSVFIYSQFLSQYRPMKIMTKKRGAFYQTEGIYMIDNNGNTESLNEVQKQCFANEIDKSGTSIEVALRLTRGVFNVMVKTIDMFLARIHLIPRKFIFDCGFKFSSCVVPNTYADNHTEKGRTPTDSDDFMSCETYNVSIVKKFERFIIDHEKEKVESSATVFGMLPGKEDTSAKVSVLLVERVMKNLDIQRGSRDSSKLYNRHALPVDLLSCKNAQMPVYLLRYANGTDTHGEMTSCALFRGLVEAEWESLFGHTMNIQLSGEGSSTKSNEDHIGGDVYVPKSLFAAPNVILKSIDEDIGYERSNLVDVHRISNRVNGFRHCGNSDENCEDDIYAENDIEDLLKNSTSFADQANAGEAINGSSDVDDVASSLIVEVVVIVDFTSPNVSFGNMKKTTVGKSNSISAMVSNAVTDAIMELRVRSRHQKMFLSTKELSYWQMHNRWIPSASESIAKLLKASLEYRDSFGGFFGCSNIDMVLDHYGPLDDIDTAAVASRINCSIFRAMGDSSMATMEGNNDDYDDNYDDEEEN